MQSMEEELSVDKILLYRAIAREAMKQDEELDPGIKDQITQRLIFFFNLL